MEFIGQAVLGRSVLDALQRRDPAVCVIRRWEEASSPPPPAIELDVEVCIDARRYGNAARFVRFSEQNPNLQRVSIFGGPHVSYLCGWLVGWRSERGDSQSNTRFVVWLFVCACV